MRTLLTRCPYDLDGHVVTIADGVDLLTAELGRVEEFDFPDVRLSVDDAVGLPLEPRHVSVEVVPKAVHYGALFARTGHQHYQDEPPHSLTSNGPVSRGDA